MPIIPSTPKLRCFGLVQNDAVLGKTTPFWAKRRRFGQNGVVLHFRFFFFFFFLEKRRKLKIKKKKKKKKEKKELGWLEPPLCPKVGWPDHPIFGQGVASATPYWLYGGGRSHPRPLGVVRPPQKAQKKKKKKKMGFGLWGWPDHPLGPGGGFGHPLPAVGGGFGHLHALGGGPATPKGQNPFFFFFFVGPFGVAGPPPKAWGGFGHPHTAGMGWPKPPLGQKWGGSATPLLGRGWLQPPRFPLLLFFFFFLLI
jgi:hypothetical protein